MDCSLPGSSIHGFSGQESWSGLPFPSPGDIPNPGIEPASPALAGGFFTTDAPGKPINSEFLQFQPRALSGSQLYILESARELVLKSEAPGSHLQRF